MSEIAARRKYSLLFALKVGGSLGVVLSLLTDFVFSLAPMGMWLFLIAITLLSVTGIIAALEPTETDIKDRGLWFAPFGYSLLVFFVLTLSSYIASESAAGGMGYLAQTVPGIASLQSSIGLSPR